MQLTQMYFKGVNGYLHVKSSQQSLKIFPVSL